MRINNMLNEVTLNQRVAFGILCAMEVYKNPKFIEWAENWLSEKDRTYASADAIAHTAANDDSYAAYAVAYAAISVASAASAAVDDVAAAAIASATHATAYAAKPIDLLVLAKQALEIDNRKDK